MTGGVPAAISRRTDARVPVGYEPRTRLARLDLLLALLLGLQAAAISLAGSGRFDPSIVLAAAMFVVFGQRSNMEQFNASVEPAKAILRK